MRPEHREEHREPSREEHTGSTSRPWLVLLGVTLVVALGACGGGGGSSSASGEKTFSRDEFDITFTYPAKFRSGDPNFSESSGGAEARIGLFLDEENGIAVSRFTLDRAVTEENLPAAVPEIDELVADLSGEPVTGTPGKVREFPAITYDRVSVKEPEGAESRLVFLFEGRTEYLINCQWTSDHRAEVDRACDQVVDTLQPA